MILDENKTHLSISFFSEEEIKELEKGKSVLRVEPLCKGGKVYFIEKGGFHFATMQEVISWQNKE